MLEILEPTNLTAFRPGETTTVKIRWELSSPIDTLELRVVWNTAGKGDQDLHIVTIIRQENPPQSGEDRIEVQLPQAPYSFSGKLISVEWALEFLCFPQEESCREVFILAPEGQEIQLIKD